MQTLHFAVWTRGHPKVQCVIVYQPILLEVSKSPLELVVRSPLNCNIFCFLETTNVSGSPALAFPQLQTSSDIFGGKGRWKPNMRPENLLESARQTELCFGFRPESLPLSLAFTLSPTWALGQDCVGVKVVALKVLPGFTWRCPGFCCPLTGAKAGKHSI